MNGIFYVTVGPVGSSIVRDEHTGKKKLRLPDNSESSLVIPKWSYVDENSPGNINVQKVNRLSELPQDRPVAIILGLSNILALDFDDKLFDIALQLPHECTHISQSVGKVGGHLLYKFEENELTRYIDNPNGKKLLSLDTLYGKCLLFINNNANTTKKTLIENDELTFCPLAMQYFVIAHYAKNKTDMFVEHRHKTEQQNYSTKLGFFINQIRVTQPTGVDTKILEHFMRIVTPRRYKDVMEIAEQQRLDQLKTALETPDVDNFIVQSLDKKYNPPINYHPDMLPESESAHMYLLAISGALMLDSSVSVDSLSYIIKYINSLFSNPLDETRVNNIIKRDCHSSKFQYNLNWQNSGYTKYNKDKELIEIFSFINGSQLLFLIYNHISKETNTLNLTNLMDYITIQFGIRPKRDEILAQIQQIKVINRPDKLFGYNHKDNVFNTYHWSQEQQVFYSPDQYLLTWTPAERSLDYTEEHPRFPKVTMAALKNAMGMKRQMFLRFMKRKYMTREYSPLIFVLFGVPHSFKSAIVNGVFNKLSFNRTKKLKHEVVFDKYNAWQVNTDLVLLDEIHHLLDFEQKKLIQQLNDISGNDVITGVRKMYADVSQEVYPNELTFFLCTNEALALSTETNDRRLVVFKSDQKLSEVLGIDDLDIKNSIQRESLDFAYYLATQVKMLDNESYIINTNWKDTQYEDFVNEGYDNEELLLKAFELQNIEAILERLEILGVNYQTIAKCLEYSTKMGSYFLRLFNSVEKNASVPSIFTFMDIDVKRIKKKSVLIKSIKRFQDDYVDGSKIQNKRTYISLGKELPQELLDYFNG